MAKSSNSNGPIASDELRLLIERWERLQEEKEGIAADQKDVMNEAKSRGYDPKTIREIIKLRKLDPNERREREAMLDTYKAALGMLDGTPLGHWALERLSKQDEPDAETEVDDGKYKAAVDLVKTTGNAAVSHVQRKLKLSYNAAAAHVERMEREGIVTAPNHVGKRDVVGFAKPEEAEPEPEVTVDDAKRMGKEAAESGAPVTANPFPARDVRRAAWDEAWCAALGSDGMDIPAALKPTPKPKKGGHEPGDEPKGAGE